ncbi:MAG: DNA-binding transcriptional MerR regulator [Oceanicoccus sp.]|jgi:DNA-binding transcriptional MerR regulator
MELPKTIDVLLDDLRALSPDGAEYLQLLIEDLECFNLSEYEPQPERARHSLPKLEDDQAELQKEIDRSIQIGINKDSIQAILKQIAASLSQKNVTLWALRPVFRHFGALPEDDVNDDTEDSPIRFYTPNLLFDRRQLDEFFKACGLIEDTKGGSGSHTKWVDANRDTFGIGSWSKKSWLKNNIKLMLQAGFPIDRIKTACDSLGIDFTVLNG